MADESSPPCPKDTGEEKNEISEVSPPEKKGDVSDLPGKQPWDNTDRKVIVYNMRKFMKPKHLDKIINGWVDDASKCGKTIKIEKFKKPNNTNWAALTLECTEMVGPFLDFINKGNQKNHSGSSYYASSAADKNNSNENKKRDNRRDKRDNDNNPTKRARTEMEDFIKTPDEVRDKLTPLWKVSYEQQLEDKLKVLINKCLKKIYSELKHKFRLLEKESKKNPSQKTKLHPLYQWLQQKRAIDIATVIPAPKKTNYRNKCEFTFGYRHEYEDEGKVAVPIKETDSVTTEATEKVKKIIKTPSVGFMAGGWSGGVSDPHCLDNVPDEFCGICDIVNTFLSTCTIPPYDVRLHRGVWRTMTIRTSERTNQCMIILVHAPAKGGLGKREDGQDDYSADFEKEKKRLIDMLTKSCIPKPKRTYSKESVIRNDSNCDNMDLVNSTDMRVTSCFFQEYDGVSCPSPEHPVQHVFGKKFLEEKLMQCTFQISPGAFFQVTTEGAEVLYNVIVDKVKEATNDPSNTMLFDVCCGTGTIGLTCMKEGVIRKVVGIDISKPAIDDAILNAERNGYSGNDGSTKFISSRAESVISNEIYASKDTHKLVVVDPARDGLHQNVLRSLRLEKGIQRIVYVSCNPTGSLVKDAVILCAPPTKKYKGLPFKPSSAQPVDMFPLTPHCELVMVFDRMSEEECLSVKDSFDKSPVIEQTKDEENMHQNQKEVEKIDDTDKKVE